MPTPNFNALQEKLLRAGIAPRHVRRYTRELRDHFEDIVAEEVQNGKSKRDAKAVATLRLGDEETLAAELLKRPELKSFAARFPWLVFGFGPVLMLIFVVAAVTLIEGGLFAVQIGAREVGIPPTVPDWIKASVAIWNGLMIYVAPLAIAAILFVLGVNQRMRTGWIVFGVVVICVVGGFHEIAMNWSDVAGEPRLSVGFGTSPPFPQFYRVVANLLLAGSLFWWWSRRVPVHA